ncbi:MAG: VWA domain-containing protein [Acidobacteria bacterium]|nr:VWA domain-containing protein [Acidobacteriota bacterium]
MSRRTKNKKSLLAVLSQRNFVVLVFSNPRLSGNRGSRGGIEIFRARSALNVNKTVMKNLFGFVYFTLLFSVFGLSTLAQQQNPTPRPGATPPASGGDNSGVVKTFEVRLPVTVVDKKKNKNLITGLKRGDFAVFENGVQQDVTFFTDEKNNPPVYVGVLMDTSPSTAGKMSFSKRAAKDFIYTVTRLRKDKAAFMTFDNEINLRQDFTDKLDLLDNAVEKVKKVGSQTALYDAVWQFSDEKLRNAPGRRVIVLITDGDDTFSRADLNDAIDIAQRTETTVFAISTKAGFLGSVPGVDAGTVKDAGDKYLTQLCEQTGGSAFFSGDMLTLEKSFTKISEELRSQYIITYRPTNQNYDGKDRKVEVRFVGKDKTDQYKIRTKTSYRAVKDTLK